MHPLIKQEIDYDINYADEFMKMVDANPKTFPDSIKLAVKRYKKWKKRKDIWWDNDKANEMLDFTQTFVRHAKSEWAGRPLILEMWQRFVFAQLYGWQKYNQKGNVVRVITSLYLQVPKKNGKTIMGIAPIIYGMYGEGVKGAEFYISANTFEQCQNAAKPLALTIENSPDLIVDTRVYKKESNVRLIQHTFIEDGIKYENTVKVLSKDNEGNEGKNPYGNLFDEVHDQMDREQYDNLKSAQVVQAEPFNIITTTAGKKTGSLGAQIYSYAKDVLKSDDDDNWLVIIYEPNKGYDWEDPEVWKIVNPNYPDVVTLDFLEKAFKEAKNNSFNKAEFLSKHLNVFVNYAETYFELDQLEKMLVDDLGELERLDCAIGVDLSKRTDLTCVSLNFPTHDDEGNPILKVKQMYFVPEFGIEEKEQKRNVPYRELADKGFVTICPGKTIDEDMVDAYIMEAYEKYNLLQINYDRALAAKLVERWEILGIPCVEVQQIHTVMNEPFDDFEILLLQDRVTTDNPLFIFCASNAKIITNLSNLKIPSKRQSPEHIDGFVAFLIAHKKTLNMMEPVVIDEEEFDDYLKQLYR